MTTDTLYIVYTACAAAMACGLSVAALFAALRERYRTGHDTILRTISPPLSLPPVGLSLATSSVV